MGASMVRQYTLSKTIFTSIRGVSHGWFLSLQHLALFLIHLLCMQQHHVWVIYVNAPGIIWITIFFLGCFIMHICLGSWGIVLLWELLSDYMGVMSWVLSRFCPNPAYGACTKFSPACFAHQGTNFNPFFRLNLSWQPMSLSEEPPDCNHKHCRIFVVDSWGDNMESCQVSAVDTCSCQQPHVDHIKHIVFPNSSQ